ncbi:RNA-directed DNA polymerase, eukaryota, reverse transcriptase zinc-binding domain protein, partial [Tanacetum coccineum]
MARWMGCDNGEFPFTYLGMPIGENMRRVNAWNTMVEKFKMKLGDWKAKTLSLWGRLTLVKSVLGSLPLLGVEFTSLFVRMVRDGRDIMFLVDRWVDNRRLCDRFLRLYHLDRKKEISVVERGEWVDNRDQWKWSLSEDGKFTVRELSRLIEEKILVSDNAGRETIWNKLVPKKVNIFVWRALRGILPVHVELDRRGVDLDSVLCPSCNNIVETCSHSLITCDLAMGVWDKIFSWWKAVCVNAFSLDEFFSSNGNVNVPTYFSRVQLILGVYWLVEDGEYP